MFERTIPGRGIAAALRGLFIVLLAAAPAAVFGGETSSDILGVWRGESICVDREIAPACKDEVLIFEFTPESGKPGEVHLKADKIVNGERMAMGEMTFHRTEKGAWESEFKNARFHGVRAYTVSGDELKGTLTDVPTGKLIRKDWGKRSK